MDQELSTNNNDLNEKLNRTQRDLTVLYEISNAMRTTLELNRILYIILTGVTAHTGLGFNRAILFLANTKERCLEPVMAIGPESHEDAHKIWSYITESDHHLDDLIKEEKIAQDITSSKLYQSIKDLKIPLTTDDGNLLSKAYHQGTLMHIPKQAIGDYADDILLQKFKTNELVVVPLKAKDKVNGLIIADNLFTQKSIASDDLKIFTMLGNQAGLAIENSRLYEVIKHKSHTDSLTNLWNHGFFQNQLTKEVGDYKEKLEPLSLIILDIDNFKELNDSYGHQNGDIIIVNIANILKAYSRDIDYACRYGGEEFSIILTKTNKDQAYQIAERIRQNIEQHRFPKFSNQEQPKVTVSIGLATFPDDAKTKEEFMTKADKAMYTAKFGGKNQTCVAD